MIECELQTDPGKYEGDGLWPCGVGSCFDAGGRLLETAMSNGVSSRYAYDQGNKLLSLENRTSQGVVSQNTYTYNSAGLRSKNQETITGFGGAQATKVYEYIYDNIDRLKQVKLGAPSSQTTVESIGYDVYNNRRKRDANSTSYYYQYDNAQQLTSVHTGSDTGPEVASFGYDDNGNLISKSEGGVTRTLAYNALDQLASVAGSDIPTEYYKYDPTGRRIEKRVNGQPERFLYSGRSIWSEYDSDWSQALAHYTYAGLDAPIMRATPDPTQTRTYHSDGLGSIVATSKASGAVDGLARYDAWGNLAASSGSIPRYGYTGREPDATGFVYYRARYYDPQIGRFLQRDPSGFADGINRYAYAGNSPASFVDPLGLTRQAATGFDSQGTSYAGNDLYGAQSVEQGWWAGVVDYVSPKGYWIYPEGRSKNLNTYQRVMTNGVGGDYDAMKKLVETRGMPAFYNPPSPGGIAFDVMETMLQKFGWGVGDRLAKQFADGLAAVDHPMKIYAHSQGTVTVLNAALRYGLPEGSKLILRSPAISKLRSDIVGGITGLDVQYDMPWGDAANLWAPSADPLKWLSGFVDIPLGFQIHKGNGL